MKPRPRCCRKDLATLVRRSLAVLLAAGSGGVWAAPPPAEVDFARDIQPLLAEKCLLCHGTDDQQSGLRLDRFESATTAADSGSRAIVPGDPAASELLARVTSTDHDLRMPPEGEPLTAAEVDRLRRWIAAGATYAEHWAYRPVVAHPAPAVQQQAWPRDDLDRFVLARLEARGIEPAHEADRPTLIRRLALDLTGLPPEPDEVQAFLADPGPDAYERLVERLLASPHFGERWGRHWLDLARYADSDGYEKDNSRPDAWRYRDWVIEAINADMPFDRFTVEQLAGDLLDDAGYSQRLATAFNRQTLTNREGGVDQEEYRVLAVMDRTETLGAAWLGLTVGCARCHSHKYDQLTHAEYFGLYAFFNDADEAEIPVPADAIVSPEALPPSDVPVGETAAEDVVARRKEKPQSVRVLAARVKKPRTTHVLEAGDFLSPAAAVEPGVPAVLPPLAARRAEARPDRLDLARWLVDPRHPLTPRVAVNHVWKHLFGRPLVASMNDFGVRGERPTHPELLDRLAADFVAGGWSRKALIRRIVTSATYRQAAAQRPELVDIDPENNLLARQNRFRVEAEIVRDATLAAAGLLSRKVGGPSVFPQLPPGIAELSYAGNFTWRTSPGEDRYRRGLYTFFKRTAPHPTLITFDCPDSNVACVERTVSNTPLAALVTLNNQVFLEAAAALAARVQAEPSDGERLTRGIWICLGRPPREGEIDRLGELLDESRRWYEVHPVEATQLVGSVTVAGTPPEELAAWTATLRVLLNLDEFLTRP
jgi:hypothetical protein